MPRPARLLLFAALSLAPIACGDDDDAATTTSAAVTTVTTGDASTTTSTAAVEGTLIQIAVAGGEVKGGGTHDVRLGDEVILQVTTDVADEVHVHGYDLLAEVDAGTTAELRFTADIPGVFEVELEGARLPLAELRVS
jgi:hypothetical protein